MGCPLQQPPAPIFRRLQCLRLNCADGPMDCWSLGTLSCVMTANENCNSVTVDHFVWRMHLFPGRKLRHPGQNAMHRSARGVSASEHLCFSWSNVFHDSQFSARLSFYVGLYEVALVDASVTLACVVLPFASLKSDFVVLSLCTTNFYVPSICHFNGTTALWFPCFLNCNSCFASKGKSNLQTQRFAQSTGDSKCWHEKKNEKKKKDNC